MAVVTLLNDCSSHLGRQHLQQPLHRRLGKPATSEARDATHVLQNLHERQHQSASPCIAKKLTAASSNTSAPGHKPQCEDTLLSFRSDGVGFVASAPGEQRRAERRRQQRSRLLQLQAGLRDQPLQRRRQLQQA